MKKLIIALLTITMLAGCGEPITIDGKEYPTYGFLNQVTSKSDNMCYEVSIGNIVWSILLIETVIMPVYFVGFSIFNPVGRPVNGQCGIDAKNARS